jgi:hypothetical protein
MSKVIAIALTLSMLCLVCRGATPAQPWEQPANGIVRGAEKLAAVLYECQSIPGRAMRCNFTELQVYKPHRYIAPDEQGRNMCAFAAHNFVQTFRPDETTDELDWVSTTGPYGACEVTRESRFIGSRPAGDTIYWTFVARIKIANKSAEDGPNRCSDLREREEVYDWQWKERPAHCTLINFDSGCSSPEFPCMHDGPVTVH